MFIHQVQEQASSDAVAVVCIILRDEAHPSHVADLRIHTLSGTWKILITTEHQPSSFNDSALWVKKVHGALQMEGGRGIDVYPPDLGSSIPSLRIKEQIKRGDIILYDSRPHSSVTILQRGTIFENSLNLLQLAGTELMRCSNNQRDKEDALSEANRMSREMEGMRETLAGKFNLMLNAKKDKITELMRRLAVAEQGGGLTDGNESDEFEATPPRSDESDEEDSRTNVKKVKAEGGSLSSVRRGGSNSTRSHSQPVAAVTSTSSRSTSIKRSRDQVGSRKGSATVFKIAEDSTDGESRESSPKRVKKGSGGAIKEEGTSRASSRGDTAGFKDKGTPPVAPADVKKDGGKAVSDDDEDTFRDWFG